MEKSIETIWKEGFLRNDLTVAPKINNLYNQKSRNIIDRIKGMMRVNLIALVMFSVVIVVWWYFLGVLYLGILVAVLLNVFAYYMKLQMEGMKELDHGACSYDYLKAFNNWLEDSIDNNVKIMRVFYPVMFLCAIATIWFSNDNATVLKELFSRHFPQMILWGDIAVVVLAVVVFVALAMAFFAGRIYRWDVNLVYGRVFRKLKEIMADMEELRS